ncbi:hypothetical protein EIP91_011372 [Steccherinum ochraceum]|uniref:60S ribosomal protein L6 n=1 Tax=Steccherinum ochraceum TaxID=92696 RepID=A0A4R0RI17_9APHY|nr:hypothetical protein EIP91_011372 [Steccherinum ochraceum]
MARSKEIAPGVGRLSRSQVFSRRGLYKGIKKSEKPAAAEVATTKEVQVKGDKNGGKRLVPTSKASRFYPAEDVRQPKKSRKHPQSSKLRSSITPGTVLILLAGRFAGKRVVFLKQLESGLLLVTGPFKINGVPLRRVNQAYVIATSTKVELGELKLDEKINDAYFKNSASKGPGSAEAEFFSEGKPKEKEPFPESKSSDQKTVDGAIIAAVKKTEALGKTYVTSTLSTLSEGFLDLALALPYSELIPAYSATIILTTVATRLIFTVPFSIWAKHRQWRLEDVVVPKLRQEVPSFQKQAVQDMKKDRYRGNEVAARMELGKRVKALVDARRRELTRLHGCSPMFTMLLPAVSQLPLFVGFSLMLNNLSRLPTVFDSESFLTLTSLAHADPTATLPIVIGLLSLANTESSRWFITAEAVEREEKVKEWAAKKRARGETVIQPKILLQNGLRLYSIARILISAMFPGSVQLYWVTSAAFGLVQTWALDIWDSRRARPSSAPQPDDKVTQTEAKAPNPQHIRRAGSLGKHKARP